MHADDSTPDLGRWSEPLIRKRQDEEYQRANLTPSQSPIDMTRMDVLDSARQEKDAELKALAKGGARDLTNQ